MSRSLGGPASGNKVVPITPEQAEKEKTYRIPEEVILVVNQLISENISGGRVTIKQKDIVARVEKVLNMTKNEMFTNHIFDIEKLYEQYGWKVEYDAPAYCETYDATFTFIRK